MAVFAAALTPLAARPPTPPKESSKLPVCSDSGFGPSIANLPPLDTPDESPSSSAEYFKTSTGKLRKKVEFSPWTKYDRPPLSNGKDSDSDSTLRRLPSRDRKPLKSILKACSDNDQMIMTNDLLEFDRSSLPAMLRSTVQHLVSDSRCSRLDAYSSLLGCLGAYDDLPETKELADQIVDILEYIRRDVTSQAEMDYGLDIQLATQALKVLTVFVCTPTVATMIPDDFCVFILERSISVFEDKASPKLIVSHFMYLIEKQRFSSKFMTTDRANRLISALDGITGRIKGNRIVGHRLMIYQRLIAQAKSVMISRVNSWIDHLISGMLSSLKDIRVRAIALGMEASLRLGTVSSISQTCVEIFNRASPEGKKVIEFLSSRLIEMIHSKEDGIHVPQIWSVIILLLRSRRQQVEHWEHLKAWLGIIQECFNSSNAQIKFQANIAWNRLIFAVNLSSSTSNSMAKMLRQPIVPQLERKNGDKNAKQAKQIARSSYCTLLYYGFRPTATHDQLDQFWDLYISQIIPTCFTSSKADINYACDVLVAILAGNDKPKLWDENRANISGPVRPDELPCIDPKWVRSRSANVLQMFNKLFKVADWESTKTDQDAPVITAWQSFIAALGTASNKEVKVSMATMSAVANILNQFKLLLVQSNDSDTEDTSDRLDTFQKINLLISIAIAKLGTLPFVEKRVILSAQNSFEAAETPSRRSSRDGWSLNSPSVHLLNLLLRAVQWNGRTATYTDILETVMQVTLLSANSRRAKLESLRGLTRILSAGGVQEGSSLAFWRLLAIATSAAMKTQQPNESNHSSPRFPGQEYRDAVKILEIGLKQHSDDNNSVWQNLYESIVESLGAEIGVEAIAPVITEVLAGLPYKDLKPCNDALLLAATSIIRGKHWPRSTYPAERVQRLLWGDIPTTKKATSTDPFENLYSMIDIMFGRVYESIELLSRDAITDFVSACSEFIQSCPTNLEEHTLSRIQYGLAVIIEDAQHVLHKYPAIFSEVESLWRAVLSVIGNLPCTNSQVIANLQRLVVSGLRTRHRTILNQSIMSWNQTFGCEGNLEYPEDLNFALRKLKNVAELRLPDFQETGDEEHLSPVCFIESQDDEETGLEKSEAILSKRLSAGRKPLTERIAVSPVRRPWLNAASPSAKSPSPARQSLKVTPRARLRHDDSQVQFAAIESSPPGPESDSQQLTDRQKEVRDRQHEEAAMFSEIRSSPLSASRPKAYDLPKLVFDPLQTRSEEPSIGDEISPVLPQDNMMTDFLGSSPTPSSSKKTSNGLQDNDDPPSSPAFVSSHPNANLQDHQPLALDGHFSMEKKAIEDSRIPAFDAQNENLPCTKDMTSAENDQETVKKAMEPLDLPDQYMTGDAPQNTLDTHVLSNLDHFVDAPSEIFQDKSAPKGDQAEVSHQTASFQSKASTNYNTEEDQVTAQLVSEMERASSQQSRHSEGTATTPKDSTRKRKRGPEVSSTSTKAKRRNHSSESKTENDESPAGEVKMDCVLVDVRPARGNQRSKPVEIKKERSPSPSFATSTQAMEIESGVQRSSQPYKSRRASRARQGSSPSDKVTKATSDSNYKTERRHSRRSKSLGSSSDSAIPEEESAGSEVSQVPGGAETLPEANLQKRQDDQDPQDPKHMNRSTSQFGHTEAEHTAFDVQLGGQGSEQVPTASPLRNPHCRTVETHGHDNGGTVEPDTGMVGNVAISQAMPSAQDILGSLQNVLENVKRVALRPEEERAMVSMLFESVHQVHDAGRRHSYQTD